MTEKDDSAADPRPPWAIEGGATVDEWNGFVALNAEHGNKFPLEPPDWFSDPDEAPADRAGWIPVLRRRRDFLPRMLQRVEQPPLPPKPPATLVAAHSRATELRTVLDACIQHLESGTTQEKTELIRTVVDSMWFAYVGHEPDRARMNAIIHAVYSGVLLHKGKGSYPPDRAAGEALAVLKVRHSDLAERVDRSLMQKAIEAWGTTKPKTGRLSQGDALRVLIKSAGIDPPSTNTVNEYVREHLKQLRERGAL